MWMYVPMALGSGAMMLMFVGNSGGFGMIGMALMSASMLAMGLGQMGKAAGDRKRRMHAERRDYLRYLGQIRKQVRKVVEEQRASLALRHPDPGALWSFAMSGRLWERRSAHPDFAEVRVGVCAQPLAMTIVPLETKPIEDLEPLSARSLRRLIAAYNTVRDLPAALFLRGFALLLLEGGREDVRDLVRALLAQLATFHSPDDLKIVIVATEDNAAEWDWTKWLPHAQHDSVQDGAGSARLFATSVAELDELLGEELGRRPKFEAAAAPNAEEPYVVVVVDGVGLPQESRLAAAGYRNSVVIDIASETKLAPRRTSLRLSCSDGQLEMIRADRSGGEIRTGLGAHDRLSVVKAAALARTISPYRLGATTEITEPMVADFDLAKLLGIPDVSTFDAATVWARHANNNSRFRVPIGLAENGARIELDIKESAQGGMGPHGLLIGATGSGKSELLRTLVLALALTHSSEILNFVLVDFKGGATFLGLDELPHTSAVITNLADEAGLVGRMQEALQGEMMRRQELLRSAGNYSSLLEYETARASGVPLDPMPTLFVVVDEFSELLAAHPDFAELFTMIGRLGRSLGVHLLLASQRLDDGRMHKLESHLSYRIGLRTFSAMESRSVIGVPDAYQLPSAPGNGFLRSDVATLMRFKAAYVSAPYRKRTAEQRQEEVRRQVVLFGSGKAPVDVAAAAPVTTEAAQEETATETILKVAVGRLRDQGPPAHQVWLPVLEAPPTLDQILPPLVPDPQFGLCPAGWPGRGMLVVPVAVVDKPYEQLRDLHMVDLAGVGGHVGIAGGTQSGKSTLLRAMMAGLALTHTAREVQFFCLDFGGGTLQTLQGLPHMGGVASRMDPDRVNRTIAEVLGVLSAREKLFAAHGIESMVDYRRMRRGGQFDEDTFGDVFLVIDGWATVRADFEEQDAVIRQISTRGLTYGVHLVITTSRWSDVPSALRDQLGTRLELRLGDHIDSIIDMRAASSVPMAPGRGLTLDKLHFLGAIPRLDGNQRVHDLADAARALADAVADNWFGASSPKVRMLPAVLPAEDLPAPQDHVKIPLGVGEADLLPVWHDFERQPHLTVMGDSASGKTAVLRLIASAVPRAYRPDEAQVIFVDSRRALLNVVPAEYRRGFAVSTAAAQELVNTAAAELRERLPGQDVTPEQLQRRDWWSGPEVFIIIDDYDLMISGMGGPLEGLLDLIPQATDIGLHIVLARSAAGSSRMSMDAALRRMQESNTPDLVFSCPPNEMPLLNGMRPKQLPEGRAMLVTRRAATLLQTGWLAPGGVV